MSNINAFIKTARLNIEAEPEQYGMQFARDLKHALQMLEIAVSALEQTTDVKGCLDDDFGEFNEIRKAALKAIEQALK